VQVGQTVLNLYLPNLQADIINDGVTAGDADKVWSIGWTMIWVALIQIITNIIAVYYSTHLAMRVGYEVRKDYFASVEKLSLHDIETFSTSSLITRATNDVQQVQMATMQSMLIILQAPIMFIGGVIMAAREDGPLTWSIAIIIPIVLLVAFIIMSQMMGLFKKFQKKLDEVNKLVREQISGVRVIRAFTRENTERKRFDDSNDALVHLLLNIGRWMGLMIPTMFFIINVSNVAIMWFGGHRIESGEMGIGSLQAFIQYLMIIMIGLMMSAMMSVMLPRASVSAKRIMEVVDTRSTITAPAQPVHNDNPQGVIEFKNVSFAYPGAEEKVLNNISFAARPGQTVAFIGATGSGKSTLVNLLPRFYDVSDGEILVDGVNVQNYDLEDLRNKVGYIPQKAVLFSGDVKGNLDFGKSQETPLSETAMWQALELAQSKNFIEDKEAGLESEVAQGGTNFSGGQRQRLAIARALARKPEILIFDDSFSALDYKTDRILRQVLAEKTQSMTKLIVAQRISTIMDADLILVLDQGKVVGQGTHKELLASNEVYQEIAYSQLSKEELEHGK